MKSTKFYQGVIRLAGPCLTGDCDCHIYDGLIVKAGAKLPPFHDGCTCIVEVPDRQVEDEEEQDG